MEERVKKVNDASLSIAMATYNGEKYIESQLLSILPYLEDRDELVLSDDGSDDCTIEKATKVCASYPNLTLKFLKGPGKGVRNNFANAVSNCNGDVILFSDQDDVWKPGKLAKIRSVFSSSGTPRVVFHNANVIDENNNVIRDLLFDSDYAKFGFWRCLLRSPFFGCCMAVESEFLKSRLDGFINSPAYDQFIGLAGIRANRIKYLDEILISHRIHGKNMSKPLPLFSKVKFRYDLVNAFSAKKGEQ